VQMRMSPGVSSFLEELAEALAKGSYAAAQPELRRRSLSRIALYTIGHPRLYRGLMYGAVGGFGLSAGYSVLTGTPTDFEAHIRRSMNFALLGAGLSMYRTPGVKDAFKNALKGVFGDEPITVGAIMKRVAGAWRARAAATGGATGA
jgi:hypothetical protein